MSELRVAWRRAVDAGTDLKGRSLSDLLAFLGPAAEASDWTCDAVAAIGPLADELRQEAGAGPIHGNVLAGLAAGITRTTDGVFEATRPGDDLPWLALRATDGGQFVVATRSRALLDDLRGRLCGDRAPVASALGED